MTGYLNRREYLAAIVMVGFGLGGFGIVNIHTRPRELMPREEVERAPVELSITDFSSLNTIPLDLKIIDCDGNLTADALCYNGKAYWHTSDWTGPLADRSRPLPNDLRATLTNRLKEEKDLRLRLYDETARFMQGYSK